MLRWTFKLQVGIYIMKLLQDLFYRSYEVLSAFYIVCVFTAVD